MFDFVNHRKINNKFLFFKRKNIKIQKPIMLIHQCQSLVLISQFLKNTQTKFQEIQIDEINISSFFFFFLGQNDNLARVTWVRDHSLKRSKSSRAMSFLATFLYSTSMIPTSWTPPVPTQKLLFCFGRIHWTLFYLRLCLPKSLKRFSEID